MQLPALVVSAVRLSGIPISTLSKEIEINRSVLSRALNGAELPEKYLPALCAAVGLEQTGTNWDPTYVARWHIYSGDKKSASASPLDLITGISTLKSPNVTKISFARDARSAEDHRRIAIAKTKSTGDDNSWSLYVIVGGSVRRLLYIDLPLRNVTENLITNTANFERIVVDEDLEHRIDLSCERFSGLHRPDDLDQLIKLIRASGPKSKLTQVEIKAIEQVAKLTGQSLKEFCLRNNIRNFPS